MPLMVTSPDALYKERYTARKRLNVPELTLPEGESRGRVEVVANPRGGDTGSFSANLTPEQLDAMDPVEMRKLINERLLGGGAPKPRDLTESEADAQHSRVMDAGKSKLGSAVETGVQSVGRGLAGGIVEPIRAVGDVTGFSENLHDVAKGGAFPLLSGLDFFMNAPESEILPEVQGQGAVAGLAEGATRFATTFAPISAALKPLSALKGGQLVHRAVSGMLADFAAWDPMSGGMTNLVQEAGDWVSKKAPTLKPMIDAGVHNQLAEWVASRDPDAPVENRVKQVVDGIATAFGFKLTGKALKTTKAAVKQAVEDTRFIRDEIAAGRINPQRGSIGDVPVGPPKEDHPVWTSKLRDTVQAKMGGKMDAEQLRKMLLAQGVKPDELKWSGFNDLKGTVTKQQALDHFDANRVEIKEMVKGFGTNDAKRLDELDNRLRAEGSLPPAEAVEYDRLTNQEAFSATEGTKFSAYKTPGGENYREMLFTLPPKEGDAAYRSAHWDEPNVLAHARFQDFVDAEGKKVLVIEEIQSDWHQEGKKKGYKNEPTPRLEKLPDGYKVEKNEADKWVVTDPRGDFVTFSTESAEKALDDTLRELNSAIGRKNAHALPAAPFSKTEQWSGLVFKRMLRYAAENGYAKLAWVGGEAQAARYDLSKQISEVHYSRTNLTAYDHNGNTVINQTGILPEQLPDYIGKEAAQKLMDQEPQGTLRSLTGQDLKVGGEGMKAFYDSILPNTVNKIVKPFGGKVETVYVSPGGEGKAAAQGVTITPSMRESVMKGQALFVGFDPAEAVKILLKAKDNIAERFPASVTLAHGLMESASKEYALSPKQLEERMKAELGENWKLVKGDLPRVYDAAYEAWKAQRVADAARPTMGPRGGVVRKLPGNFSTMPGAEAQNIMDQLWADARAEITGKRLGYEPGGGVVNFDRMGDEEAKKVLDAVLNARPDEGKPTTKVDTMIAELRAGGMEPDRFIDNPTGPGSEVVQGFSYHADWFRSLGTTKAELLPVLENVQRGKKLTEKQALLWREASRSYDSANAALMEATPKMQIQADSLRVGDVFTMDGKKVEVIAKHDNGSLLPELEIRAEGFDKPQRVTGDFVLEADAGSLRSAGEEPSALFAARAKRREGLNFDMIRARGAGIIERLNQDPKAFDEYLNALAEWQPGDTRIPLTEEGVYVARNIRETLAKRAGEALQADDMASFAQWAGALNRITPTVEGMTATLARGTSAHRMASIAERADSQFAANMHKLMDSTADAETKRTMLKALKTPQQLADLMRKADSPKFYDYFMDWWYKSVLSGPQTWTANAVSGPIMFGIEVAKRAEAGLVGSVRRAISGSTEGVRMRESLDMVNSLATTFQEIHQFVKNAEESGLTKYEGFQGWRAGNRELTGVDEKFGKSRIREARNVVEASRQAGLPDETGSMRTAAQQAEKQAALLGPEGMEELRGEAGWFWRAVDYYLAGTDLIHLPMSWGDEITRTIATRADLRALAGREAAEMGLDGVAAARHVEEVLRNPPDEMIDEARTFSRLISFTSELGATAKLWDNAINATPVAKLVFSFFRTSMNIAKYAYGHTALGFAFPSTWREIAAGGAERDLAIAKLGTGLLTTTAGFYLASNGYVSGSGPTDPELRQLWERDGNRPYSFNIPKSDGTFYHVPFARYEPLGQWFGAVADMVYMHEHMDETEKDRSVLALLAGGMKKGLGSTYMQGVQRIGDMAQNPERYTGPFMESIVGSLFMPNLANQTNKTFFDPEIKEVNSILDAVKARTPGWSHDVKPSLNIWGEPRLSNSNSVWPAAVQLFAPGATKDNPDPLDQEMLRLGQLGVDMPLSKPGRKQDGYKLDDDEYYQFSRMAGQRAREELLAEVKDRGTWELFGGAQDKANHITEVIRRHRREVWDEMREASPRIQDEINTRTRRQDEKNLRQ